VSVAICMLQLDATLCHATGSEL